MTNRNAEFAAGRRSATKPWILDRLKDGFYGATCARIKSAQTLQQGGHDPDLGLRHARQLREQHR
eukprot:1417755-Alexandrium_andersonii.AAC.1